MSTVKLMAVGIFLLGFGVMLGASLNRKSAPLPLTSQQSVATLTPTPGVRPTGIGTNLPIDGSFLVKRVIDGDTIELENGERVRYIGIDTPETVDPRSPVQCFGKEASTKNKELVEGKRVRLERDVSDRDQYGRLLRYVFIPIGDGSEVFVNLELVRQGFANVSTYPPDVKYQNQFLVAQSDARNSSRGLWAKCPLGVITPFISPQPGDTAILGDQHDPSCTIKGNISSTGEKIYHLPGCGSYEKTQIDKGRGERWFCSEDDAVQAGWRKAKNC